MSCRPGHEPLSQAVAAVETTTDARARHLAKRLVSERLSDLVSGIADQFEHCWPAIASRERRYAKALLDLSRKLGHPTKLLDQQRSA